MDAAHTVFSTYELLEGILINISPKGLTKAMRVSRNWHDLVVRSVTLREARILPPLGKYGIDPRSHPGFVPEPVYDGKFSLRYNHRDMLRNEWIPGLHCSSYSFQYDIHRFEINHKNTTQAGFLAEIRDRYVTVPPCQALGLLDQENWNNCHVYVKDGVRFRDVEEAVLGMRNTANRYIGK